MNKFSDHWPIFLQFDGFSSKQKFPFKFNIYWIENEALCTFVHYTWLSYKFDESHNPMDHLVSKLKALKESITS